MPSAPHRASDLSDICFSLPRVSKEMKDRAIVPEIICTGAKLDLRDVRNDPMHALSKRSQAFTIRLHCSLGNVQNRDLLVTTCEKIVHQSGLAAANIDD